MENLNRLTYKDETHEYFLDNKKIVGVTSLISEFGISDFSCVNKELLERSQKFGNAVHKMCELYDKGILDLSTLDKNLIPYLGGWKKFLKDYHINGFSENGIEVKVFSEKFKYAGRLDRLLDHAIIDIKTNETFYKKPTSMQLTGYKIAYEELNPSIIISALWCIQLFNDGRYIVTPCEFVPIQFLSAINLHYYKLK
jgi:hypothetical protein